MDTESPNILRAASLAARLATARGDSPAAWYWRGVVDGIEHATDDHCRAQTRRAHADRCGGDYCDGLVTGIAHAYGVAAIAN